MMQSLYPAPSGEPGGAIGAPPYNPRGNYALGGTVPRPIGLPQLAVVHGGETITPAGQTTNNSHTYSIVVNIAGNGSRAEVEAGVLAALRAAGMA